MAVSSSLHRGFEHVAVSTGARRRAAGVACLLLVIVRCRRRLRMRAPSPPPNAGSVRLATTVDRAVAAASPYMPVSSPDWSFSGPNEFRRSGPVVAWAPVDCTALAKCGRPVGLALRVGAYGGPFDSTARPTSVIVRAANELLNRAKAAGMNCRELQIDFDCPESKLDGYRQWVAAIQDAVRPVPVVITALPCWLGRDAFGPLVRQAGGYVLQVHSLERTKGPSAAITLCDRDAAGRAVERGGPLRRAVSRRRCRRTASLRVRRLGEVSWPVGSSGPTVRGGDRHNADGSRRTGCDGTARGRHGPAIAPPACAGSSGIECRPTTTTLALSCPTLRCVMAGR